MLRKLRIEQIRDVFWLMLFFFVGVVVLFGYTGFSVITALMGAKPLTADEELSDRVGEYVSWEVQYPLDEYLETTKTTKVNGVSKGTEKERSSWMVLDADRGICLSVEVPYKRYEEMVDQAEAFYNAVEQDKESVSMSVHVSGSLEILEGEELSYYNRAVSRMGLDPDDVVYHYLLKNDREALLNMKYRT